MGFLLITFSRFTLFLLSLKLEILLCLLTLLWRRSTKPEGSSLLWRVIHQGEMDNVDDLLKKYSLPTTTVDVDEVHIVIRALKILHEHTYLTPEHILNDLHGDFSFVFFDSSTKLLFLTTGIPTVAPLYWGIDSKSSLILSDDKNVVKEACASAIQPFPDDEVYISRRGHVGLEAIFHDYTAEDVEQQPVERRRPNMSQE